MKMQRKYGMEWPIAPGEPEGGSQEAFDQFENLLIYSSRQDALAARSRLPAARLPDAEPCELLMVPSGAGLAMSDRFTDFGFIGARGHAYIELAYTAVFRLIANTPEAEPAPAWMQLEEHRIAAIASEEGREDMLAWQVIERQLAELADRVARAYRCTIEWLDTARL